MNATMPSQSSPLVTPLELVIPVRYVDEGEIVHTTSTNLNTDSVHVRALKPPRPGRVLGLHLFFPEIREAVAPISVVAARTTGPTPGFWAEFGGDDGVRDRIAGLLQRHLDAARRACQRFHTALAATVRHRNSPECNGQVSNISQTGAFIRLESPPSKGSVVELDIAFPDDPIPFTVMAFVVHVAPRRGVGVQFIGAADEFREHLDRHLACLAGL